jgi:pimeloyl-ACP methyl ester carboxylesterase
MERKNLKSENGTVYYWLGGDSKTAIIFTHGATMDHGMFQPQMEFFADRYRTISWDVPQHGSSRPYENFSLQSAAEELVHILDAEKIDKAHLVGQSMGGYIIQIAALNHPDRVISLTAVDSSPIQPFYFSALDNWLLRITPALLKLYPYHTLVNTIASQIALTSAGQDYARETLQSYTKGEIADIMGAVYSGLRVYTDDFNLPQPLLVTYGDADNTGKVQAYCDRWAEIEDRTLVVIPNAAHNANMDNPEYFNKILDEFLLSVSG